MSIPAQGETELLLFLTACQRASGPTAARLFASLWLLSEDPGGRSVRSEGEIILNYHIRKQVKAPLLLSRRSAVVYMCSVIILESHSKKCLDLKGEPFWANV